MTFLIGHQMQPTMNTCFSTCLAMIKAEPAGSVIDQIHEWYFGGGVSTREALDRLGIPFESFDTADLPFFQNDGAYLVAVPSLNMPGGLHQIIVECFDGQMKAIDPAAGVKGWKYYVSELTEGYENEIKLYGYMIDAFIDRKYLEQRYAFKLGEDAA